MSIHADKVFLYIDKIGNFGSFPPYARIAAQNDPIIDGILFNPTDPDVTPARMNEARAKLTNRGTHFLVGIMWDPSWDGYPVASVAVQKLEAHIVRLAPDYVVVDGEIHNAFWIRDFLWGSVTGAGVALRGYRGVGGNRNLVGGTRPGKATDWTLESNQDGNWNQLPAGDTVYTDMAMARMSPIVQPYGGGMEPFSQETALKYVTSLGFPVAWVHLCHDPAKGLPSRVRAGVIFSADRWPAMYGVTARLLRKPQRVHKRQIKQRAQLREIAKTGRDPSYTGIALRQPKEGTNGE